MERKILIASPSAYPLGGVATWLDYLVPGLRQRGWDVQVALASGTLHDAAAYERAHPGLPVVRVAARTGTREGRVRALARAIRGSGAALVLAVNLPDAYAAVERLRSRGRGRAAPGPCVAMTIHGLEPDLYDDLREHREAIDGVVCTNRLACRLAVVEGGAKPARVHYAPYGVEVSNGMPAALAALAPPAATELAGAEKQVLDVAFVGRLEESQKRIGDLARIAETLAARRAPVRITIAGDGPEDAWLRARLAPLVTRGTVRLLGRVPAAQVPERVYRSADVLLITSSWETGPIVAWEAMARGVCVVGSRYVGSGLEGALADGENCLLFPVGDAEAAAAAIIRLVDPQERRRLAGAGLETVRSRYGIAASVGAWHDALVRIVEAQPGGVRSRPAAVAPAGRLDRALGGWAAESLREVLRRPARSAGGPGDEWPHSYGRRAESDPGFRERAARVDAGGAGS